MGRGRGKGKEEEGKEGEEEANSVPARTECCCSITGEDP